MKKIALFMLGLILSGVAGATTADPREFTSHIVTLVGLNPGEGRYIRSDLFENNKFQSGYYFCAGADSSVYELAYYFSRSNEPFHVDHLTRFSICQDETLANCEEFAADKYTTFKNIDGYLENDVTKSTIDVSPLKGAYQPCEPSPLLDQMVKKSIHLSDRLFAHVG